MKTIVYLPDDLHARLRHLAVDQIDTSTPLGRMIFHVSAAFAELENEIIRERVRAGLRNARKRGKRLGRRPAIINVERICELAASGISGRAIARQVGVAEGTIRNVLRRCAKIPAAPAPASPMNPRP